MRLALLGLDETIVALARAAHESGRDTAVLLCDGDESDRAQQLPPGVSHGSQSWEVLLTGTRDGTSGFDAVLVSREASDDERRLEQLRKLTQAGVPMLVAHPIHGSMLAYYELDMIRRETDCILAPFLPARLHPLARRLKEIIAAADASTVGEVSQIVFERALHQRTKASVLAHFARDVDLLRFLGGEVTQLGATGSPGANAAGEPAAYDTLGVQMTGAEDRLLRWWVVPADEFSGGRLTLTGARGKARLSLPPESSDWRLEVRCEGETNVVDASDWSPYLSSLDELRAALVARETPSRWPDAARSLELAETIDRSLAKARTINLYEQEYSSAATFKGIMSSVGCALLLLALAGMVLGALAANLLKHAGFLRAAQLVGAVPYVLLGLLVVFLALQFLLSVTGTRR
jgi:predicted dehydrogenase